MKNPKKHDWFCSCLQPLPPITGERAVGVRGKFWTPGQNIRVGFLGGNTTQQNRVKAAFAEWKKYANLNHTFPASGPYDIRISFIAAYGAWSYIGTDALYVTSQTTPTMNLGFSYLNSAGLDYVALHEIGHEHGAGHEQSFPAPNGHCFIWPNVIADLKRTQGWDEATIHFNMDPYAAASVITTPTIDIKSIMEYGLPANWMCNGVAVPGTTELSPNDKSFWGGIYPYATTPIDPPTGVTITPVQAQELRQGALNVQTATNTANEAAKAHRAKIQAYLGQ